MIKTNLPIGISQDRRPDGSIRAIIFVDILYDGSNQLVRRMLDAVRAVMEASTQPDGDEEMDKAPCEHPKWAFRAGSMQRYCELCNADLPAEEEMVKKHLPYDNCGEKTCQQCYIDGWR